MEKYIKSDQILDIIKETIYELYPIKKPRVEINDSTYSYKSEELKICFYFYNVEEGEICAQICFMKHHNYTFKYYLVDKEPSYDVIGGLIKFLLTEFPYVNSVSESANGFSLEFGIGMEHHDMEGISCNKINIVFDTHSELYNQFSSLFNSYFEYIMSIFGEEIGKNSLSSRGYYRGYYDMLKPIMIKKISSSELQQIASLLTDEEIYSLLLQMSNERFFKLVDSLNKDNSKPKGNIRELKPTSNLKNSTKLNH